MADVKPDIKPDEKKQKAAKLATKTVVKDKNNKKRIDSLKRYFIETKAEFKKIVWPTPKQVLNNTIVVLVMIVVVGAIIWILDGATSSALSAFLKHYSNS
jgi:preprotein translocase subunit SecE